MILTVLQLLWRLTTPGRPRRLLARSASRSGGRRRARLCFPNTRTGRPRSANRRPMKQVSAFFRARAGEICGSMESIKTPSTPRQDKAGANVICFRADFSYILFFSFRRPSRSGPQQPCASQEATDLLGYINDDFYDFSNSLQYIAFVSVKRVHVSIFKTKGISSMYQRM